MIDILAFGAHPDDIELGIGGILAKAVNNGFKVGMIDLTKGEMASRGTVEERQIEAQNASNILGVPIRENLGLKDSQIQPVWEQKIAVIQAIRKHRPRIIFATMSEDKHPDHHNAHYLIREANYLSGLHKIETGQEPYRCQTLLYYYPYYEIHTPTFVIDISNYFEQKIKSLQAHRSQFFNPDYSGPQTFISSEKFWDSIRNRCAYWGSKINVLYGETIYTTEPIKFELDCLLKYYEKE